MNSLDNLKLVPEAHKDLSTAEPYLQYFYSFIMFFGYEALLPEDRSRESGMMSIYFYGENEDQPTVKIFRSISKYSDGNIGVQDGIHILNENSEVQVNFEVNYEIGRGVELVEYPKVERVSEGMRRIVELILEMGKIKGSIIMFKRKDAYVSDGENWVPTSKSKDLNNSSKNPQLEG